MNENTIKALKILFKSTRYLVPSDQKRTLWVSPEWYGPISKWVKAKKIKNVEIICPSCTRKTKKKKK